MNIQSIDGITPIISPAAYIDPSATIIGDVIINEGCYIGPGACIRGDFSRIDIQSHSYIQDNCILHSSPEHPINIASHVIISHGATLHGCTIHSHVLIGINAIILDGVTIPQHTFVAATSLVNNTQLHSESMYLKGNPGLIKRTLSAKEHTYIEQGLQSYEDLVQRYKSTGTSTMPLTHAECHNRQHHKNK
jgi:phenylacetic acid degradation protein